MKVTVNQLIKMSTIYIKSFYSIFQSRIKRLLIYYISGAPHIHIVDDGGDEFGMMRSVGGGGGDACGLHGGGGDALP